MFQKHCKKYAYKNRSILCCEFFPFLSLFFWHLTSIFLWQLDHWLNMRKLGYSDFAIQTWKLAARLSISCLLFPYPAIIQHSTVQKYPACFVLNRWLLQWFGVYLTWSSHFARAFHELQCIVRVISAARFENTWPAHSANFENGIETGLEYFVQSDR